MEDKLLYTINTSSSYIDRVTGTPEILDYTINLSGRLNFKFILKPKIKIHSDTSNNNDPFANIYLENEFDDDKDLNENKIICKYISC